MKNSEDNNYGIRFKSKTEAIEQLCLKVFGATPIYESSLEDLKTEEIKNLKSQLTQTHGAVTISRNGYVQELEQQRDMLAEAIRKHRDELELTSGESVDRILWNTLAAVKENQKTDSQSCPECDALASYESNDGPCETHKL
jgi:hypothetical protein